MSSSIRVIQVGLGPIGLGAVSRMAARPDIRVVAAVDPDPAKAGRTLGELLRESAGTAGSDPGAAGNVRVQPTLAEALAGLAERPQVAVHTTSSFLSVVAGQLVQLAEAGLNVVSTTEELSYPWWHHPDEARAIDEAAKAHGVTVLGTGVNPGFVMDLLPVFLTGIAQEVERVEAVRVVDAGTRRGPLQRKIGAGITPAEFEERKATGRFGHVGLPESVAMIAAGLGWSLARIETSLRPVLAERPYASDVVRVEPGNVLGIDQVATGHDASGRERIRLHLQMYVGAPNPHDAVRLFGLPNLEFTVPAGVPGDGATVAAIVAALPRVLAAPAGLKTVLDLPVPRWSDPGAASVHRGGDAV